MSRRFTKEKTIIGVLWTVALLVLSYIMNAATQGVIGSFAYDVIYPWITVLPTMMMRWSPVMIPVLFFVLLAALSVGVYAYWYTSHMAKEAEEIYEDLIKIDDILFGFVQDMIKARTVSVDELDGVTKKVIEYLIASANTVFDKDIPAGAVFCVDPADHKLKIWAHHYIDQETINSLQFDISASIPLPAGMARESYLQKSIEVGRIEKQGKHWECSNKHYVTVNTLTGPPLSEPPLPPYASLVCVPVLDPISPIPFGVLTLCSKDKSVFTDLDTFPLLEQLAKRVAQALVLYQFLK